MCDVSPCKLTFAICESSLKPRDVSSKGRGGCFANKNKKIKYLAKERTIRRPNTKQTMRDTSSLSAILSKLSNEINCEQEVMQNESRMSHGESVKAVKP